MELQQQVHHFNWKWCQTNILILGGWAIHWYLVCIEFRSCYNFNCLLFDVRFRNESIQVYALIFTLTLHLFQYNICLGFVMCCLLVRIMEFYWVATELSIMYCIPWASLFEIRCNTSEEKTNTFFGLCCSTWKKRNVVYSLRARR